MGKYTFIIRRLVLVIPTVFIIATIVFFLFNVLPGDAAILFSGLAEGGRMTYKEFREKMGLDVPIHIRYFKWLQSIIHGDMGNSLRTGESVSELISRRLPVTLLLALMSTIIGVIPAIPLGILAAIKRNTKWGALVSGGSLLGLSIPGFWLGLELILIFSVWLRLLPPGDVNINLLRSDLIESLRRLIMPSIVLGLFLMANVVRMTRSSVLEVLRQDYVIFARSKGLSERVVLYRHVLKNAMIPIITIVGLQILMLVGGAVITEQVFLIKGIADLILNAVFYRDYPVLQGSILTISLIFVIVNFAIDLIYKYLDPRIRLR